MLARMVRKAVALALSALITASGLQSLAAAPAGAAACPYTDMPSAQLSLSEFDASIFCLVNQTRAENGLRQLRPNHLLHRAALNYTNSLMEGRFFSHYGDFAGHPNASTPIGRLRQVGYVRSGYVWVVGEDLRWSTPETGTSADILEMWM